jgi:hypothetical protein
LNDIRGDARTLALSAVLVAAVLFSPTASAEAPDLRYEAFFAKSFPPSGGAHRITDWNLYSALVTGDVVTYAAKLDPAVAQQLDQVRGRPYQTQQLERRIKEDGRLVAAFDQQRRRLKSMLVHTGSGGVDADSCERHFVYVGNEFRLVLGESSEGGDPLSHATIAPGCPTSLARGFQLTAGRSTRFKCWTAPYSTLCGWRLPDMPEALKAVIETTYPSKTTLRWRWRGLGGVVRTRYLDGSGNRVAARDSLPLTVPLDLRLELVDEVDRVLWTTPAQIGPTTSRGPRASP